MVYREIIAVCSHIHTQYVNTLCGQNVQLLNVKLVVQGFEGLMYRSWAQQSQYFISLCLCTATANSLVAQCVPSQLPDQPVGLYSDKIGENSVLSHRMTS
jgi:hypothetical protein